MAFLQQIGAAFLGFLNAIGRLSMFTGSALSHSLRPPFYGRLMIRQMIEIGYYSLPVVGLTTLFSGMVLALQSYTGFARFSAEGAVATVVVLSMTRELAPVLAGLMVAGRVGAAIAAEIGTMRVTEQIDALTTLSTNPMKYLVAPRLIAGMTMLPIFGAPVSASSGRRMAMPAFMALAAMSTSGTNSTPSRKSTPTISMPATRPLVRTS